MKVIVIKGSPESELIQSYVHKVEEISDNCFIEAVVNTSFVNKNSTEVFSILEESYQDNDYDVFILIIDFITSKHQEILDKVNAEDIMYISPELIALEPVQRFLEN